MAYSFAQQIEAATFYETLLKFYRLYIVTFQKAVIFIVTVRRTSGKT